MTTKKPFWETYDHPILGYRIRPTIKDHSLARRTKSSFIPTHTILKH